MPDFHRIETRIESRAQLKLVAIELTGLATELGLLAHDTRKHPDDEAALLLARERIKTASQKMRKGLKNAG